MIKCFNAGDDRKNVLQVLQERHSERKLSVFLPEVCSSRTSHRSRPVYVPVSQVFINSKAVQLLPDVFRATLYLLSEMPETKLWNLLSKVYEI